MMLGFVQNFLAPKANPIGVDFGSDGLRLAQVQAVNGEFRLMAAAAADVPSHVRHDATQRMAWFGRTIRELLAQGHFKGHRAVLALPAAWMHIQHLRLPKMDEEATKKALPWEARGKLPIDPSHALLRHVIAGEIYHDQEPKNEVIVMAANREMVNQFLAAAERAHLEVAGMNVESRALLDCFGHIYRRKTDQEKAACFVDIGASGTRVIVAQAGKILFARAIPIGGDQFNRAVAGEMKISLEEARMMRIKLAADASPLLDDRRDKQAVAPAVPAPPIEQQANEEEAEQAASASMEQSFALLDAGLKAGQRQAVDAAPAERFGTAVVAQTAPARAPAAGEPNNAQSRVDHACQEPLGRLIAELNLCRRYHEATFQNSPIERLIFIGGEARQRSLCQQIARELSLMAQVGDPLARMGRLGEAVEESGIDRRQPQPGWAVAIGLSMGQA